MTSDARSRRALPGAARATGAAVVVCLLAMFVASGAAAQTPGTHPPAAAPSGETHRNGETAAEPEPAPEDQEADLEWMRELEEFADEERVLLETPSAARFSEFEDAVPAGRRHVVVGAIASFMLSTAELDHGRAGRERPGPTPHARGLRRELPHDIPLVYNEMVDDYLRFFQGRGRKYFTRWLARTTRYSPLVKPVLKEYKLPEDTIYLAMIESGFSPYAVSRAAAAGMWQFMPRTGVRYGLTIDFWRDERRDPVKATHAAARFLRDLYAYFGSWWLAWAGYNSGEGKIFRALKKYDTADFWEISSTKFLRKETRHYVPKLIAAALISKDPARYGFEGVEYLPPLEFDELEVPSPADLRVIAAAAGTDLDTIRDLNPELRRGCTPANMATYVVHVPKGSREKARAAIKALKPGELLKFEVHVTKKGETAASVAKAKGVKASVVAEFNNIKDAKTAMKAGTELKVPMVTVPDEEMEDRYDKKLNRHLARIKGKKGKDGGRKGGAPKGDGEGYTVQSGDNPWDIASQHGVGVQDLLDENSMDRSDRIYPGMKIRIPKKGK